MNIQRVIKLLFSIALIFAVYTVNSVPQSVITPKQPDYENPIYWYGELIFPADNNVDIFYVYPTVGTKPTDDNGNRLIYTNVDKKAERDAAMGNQRFNMEVYGRDQYNFFAPYYRQMTLELYAGGRQSVSQYVSVPASDIARAFAYYMKHLNNGRPFILLGHSQGSQVLIELLKHSITDEQRKLMVAAYTMGFEITSEELARYPSELCPAQNAEDTGVIVLYNSLTDSAAKSPILDRSAVCINPLNWRTDGTPATKEEHKGIVKYDSKAGAYVIIPNFTGAYISDNCLVCEDIDPYACYIEELKELFPFGNLHMMDSWLYSVNIRENMDLRTSRFQSKHRLIKL